jgi:hypothetical protein
MTTNETDSAAGITRKRPPRRSRAAALAKDLLRDRAERAARKAEAAAKPAVDKGEFDPFPVTRWRVITPNGGNPGYLPKTPMRRGPVGWFIACQHCGAEFESKGWAYCPTCMDLPAEARRRERAPAGLPDSLQPTRSHGRPSPSVSTPETAQKTQCLIGPQDFPINIVGGQRLPQEGPNPLGRVRVRPWV